jgi:hypothetical protein
MQLDYVIANIFLINILVKNQDQDKMVFKIKNNQKTKNNIVKILIYGRQNKQLNYLI